MWGTRAQGVTLVGFVVGVTLAASIAMAEPQNPFAGECNRTATDEDIEGAKGAHKAARQFYERGEYARAIQYWRDVFNLDCKAVGTLLNIANAYEKLGDRQNAIFALEAYIQRSPDSPDVPKIKTRVENLKSLQQSQAATASASAPPPPPTTSSSAPPPPPPPAVKPFGLAPWITVGVGGAALVAGAILTPVGLGKIDSVTGEGKCIEVADNGDPSAGTGADATPSPGSGQWLCATKDDQDTAVAGKTLAVAGKYLLIGGGAALAGGLVWELLFNKPVAASATTPSEKTGHVRVTPSVGPGMSGVLVHGSF